MSDGAMSGAELKFLRSEMGMTPNEFGKLVYRKGATISRWEREECTMDGALEAFIRILASTKLGLSVLDPEEIASKCAPTKQPKSKITIKMPEPNLSRLAA